MDPLFDPADFRLPAGIAHVCAGGETAFLHRHDAALLAYARDKSLGEPGRYAQEKAVLRARDLVAAAWGVARDDIGFCAHVAEGVSLVVESIDWREGDNLVVDPDEYPSVVAPAALHRHPRIGIRFARMSDPDAVAAAVDGRTRLIGVSHVSYLTGERLDLAPLRAIADGVGALLVVDHTQAAGYIEIRPHLADFAFAATYKWLLGMTGTAIAYWNRARQPAWSPATAGWHNLAGGTARPDWQGGAVALVPDAMRFSRGNPAHASVYVLGSALDYLAEFETTALTQHVQRLTAVLLARLPESTTPRDPARRGASVCITHPDASRICKVLHEQGVWAWNGRGRVRFSFHGYNGMADVERVVAALKGVGLC